MQLVATATELQELLPTLEKATRLAFDLEANGRFAYRARVCTIQLAWDEGTAIIDALAADLRPLARVLGERGPIKIVHDVAFDARMLAELGIELGNVQDTALAAQMLGRPATGLASLAASELGVTLDKTLQSHDWGKRPLAAASLAYLETDVRHLPALCDKLWAEVRGEGGPHPGTSIETEVLDETRHRLASAIAGARAASDEGGPRPAYTRIKGIDKLSPADQAIVRRLAETREREAELLDFPANELIGNSALLELARVRPTTVEELRRIKGAMPRHKGYAIARELVHAIAKGIADASVPDADRPWLERPRIAPEVAKTRRAREVTLLAWRKAVALERHVNEQVVLPGHCLQGVTELDAVDLAHLQAVPGIGALRVERDGPAILALLTALTEEPKAG